MSGDWTFIVQRWYARDNFPETARDLWKAWANSVSVSFRIGYTHTWTRSLFELCERRPRTASDAAPRVAADPFPVVIPPRQNFQVQLDQFGDSTELAYAVRPPTETSAFRARVWIHLEGVVVTHNSHRPDDVDTIVNAIIGTQKETVTTEERIVQWLGAQMRDASVDARAQLHAVMDGIMEGRHRS